MRVFNRNDIVLVVGLATSVFVVFSKPLGQVLDYVHQIEVNRGLNLVAAFLILAAVLVFHQIRKRQEKSAEAVDAMVAARQATERANELARVVAFGQALARSLDEASIRAAATSHLPRLAPGRAAWTVIKTGERWRPLSSDGSSQAVDMRRALRYSLGQDDPLASTSGDCVCFPMIVGGHPVGVLGVSADPPLDDRHRTVLTAAAALLAVSVKNAELFLEVRENSARDALTGCFTRRHGLEAMDAELRRARRSRMPLSVLMLDLDHFKDINDRHGHLCGDAVLAETGARMRTVLRGSDIKCRYGGEEFLIVLPETPLAGARQAAESLRREIAGHPVAWNGHAISVTASIGMTDVTTGEIEVLQILARADSALYRAKEAGRNCVRATEDPVTVS